jgi:NAD-dependent SIR2 family protein deacetylase
VAYTGAGISTSSGIGDYATRAEHTLTPLGARTSDQMAARSPLVAEPSPAHHALVKLHRAGMLAGGWVQQNHDGLPQKVRAIFNARRLTSHSSLCIR